MCFWLQRFVLESGGNHYCPESLYQVACGLQWFLRDMNMDVNIFEGYEFSQFRSVLDGASYCCDTCNRSSLTSLSGTSPPSLSE